MKITAMSAVLNGAPCLWAGDQASFDLVADVMRQVADLSPEKLAHLESRVMARDENGLPMLWEKRGAVAVLNISGGLIDGYAGYGRYFNVIGYDDIAEAAIVAYSDPDVKSVMWKIESPGGQVSGVMECGALVAQLSSMKPSMAYTGNLMASGGYWLGSSVKGEILAGPTAEVGSIGVLMVVTDLTKALADQGVKKTVMRAGEDKARVNPYEPLTPEAKAQLQQSMDDVHSLFRAQVSKGRPGMSTEDTLAATTGRTFLGKRAKSAGLVDKVASFEQALKLLDNQIPKGNTPSNSKGSTMKTVLTDIQIALIASGVKVSDPSLGLTSAEVVDVEAEQERQAAAAKAVSDKAAEDAAKAALQATADAAAAEAAKKLAGAAETDIVKVTASLATANVQVGLLQSQLVTAQATLVSKEAELVNLKASTQSMTANHDGLLEVTRANVARLSIALGGSDAASLTMDASTAVAEFKRLNAVFLAKFKPGGVARASTDAKPATPDVNPEFLRVAAAAQAKRNAK